MFRHVKMVTFVANRQQLRIHIRRKRNVVLGIKRSIQRYRRFEFSRFDQLQQVSTMLRGIKILCFESVGVVGIVIVGVVVVGVVASGNKRVVDD